MNLISNRVCGLLSVSSSELVLKMASFKFLVKVLKKNYDEDIKYLIKDDSSRRRKIDEILGDDSFNSWLTKRLISQLYGWDEMNLFVGNKRVLNINSLFIGYSNALAKAREIDIDIKEQPYNTIKDIIN